MLTLAGSSYAFELSITFFLQLAAILVAIRVVGLAARALGQPQVVGEMITGVLLGPSLLGWIAPELSAELFPRTQELVTADGGGGVSIQHPLMVVIYCCAQVGLVLYMFVVGMEFRVDIVRSKLRAAAAISLAGILTPFALGAALAWGTHSGLGLFREDVSTGEALLFMGAAMSITAFPMLARIIVERGIAHTTVGTLALAAGSIDDAIAWCILAVVLASFKHDAQLAWMAIGGGVLYAVVVVGVLRPALRPIGKLADKPGGVPTHALGLVLAGLMTAAWYTDDVGIYAVFGAFIFGLSMPRGPFVEDLRRKIEPLTVNLLLPMFFVYSGLNTQITLVNTPLLWLITLGVLAAACAGKFAACWAAARICGEPNRESAAIGSLMNARGLMELIILNIGLEHGVITPTLFSIMVIMAIVTTLMATPLFNLVMRGYQPVRLPEVSP